MLSKVEIHGHRGARGLLPENTLSAFKEAVNFGVDAIELDVVISKDNQIVVSHEEWMNADFCLLPDGKEILTSDEKLYNLFNMSYNEIKMFDCGTKTNRHFPFQKSEKAYKPLLSEVIGFIEEFTKINNLKPVTYNIEIKSEIANEPTFQPRPDKIVDLVLHCLSKFSINERVIIQSFDSRILEIINKQNRHFRLGYLIENNNDFETNLSKLCFKPHYYNPEYILVTKELITYMHQKNIKVIPWTVNDSDVMKHLLKLGVDGIITDYPNIALEVLKCS